MLLYLLLDSSKFDSICSRMLIAGGPGGEEIPQLLRQGKKFHVGSISLSLALFAGQISY